MTLTFTEKTRGQALHTLKTMWVLCEVAKEEEIWRPKFDSFDQLSDMMNMMKTKSKNFDDLIYKNSK